MTENMMKFLAEAEKDAAFAEKVTFILEVGEGGPAAGVEGELLRVREPRTSLQHQIRGRARECSVVAVPDGQIPQYLHGLVV